uniref:Uncharacterized protein n=1 Tax=Rhizophora mucronata TaxID=61149 RepID=A0A2P2JAR5_RHIMU
MLFCFIIFRFIAGFEFLMLDASAICTCKCKAHNFFLFSEKH